MSLPWIDYLFSFAAVLLILYSFVPKRYRYILILVLSLAAYVFYSGRMTAFIVITVITVYFSAHFIEKIKENFKKNTALLSREEKKVLKKKRDRRCTAVLAAAVIINLGILVILKYKGFFATSLASILKMPENHMLVGIIMPLGLSYYTLQAISYVIDVKEGSCEAEHNIFKTALFICYFPQLSEGPFGRYGEMKGTLFAGEPINSNNVFSGIMLIIWGAFKEYMIAGRLSMYTDKIFKEHTEYGGLAIFFCAVAFTLQLYADFSGNIDMVRGVSQIFGIKLAPNFDRPFISQNVGEFWRRWHISLGRWFKDYIFFPISTSSFAKWLHKRLKSKTADNISIIIALLTVWVLTGAWHGVGLQYVVYGLYYFVLIVLHMITEPLGMRIRERLKISDGSRALKFARITFTFLLVCVGMLLFRAKGLAVFGSMFVSMFSRTRGFNAIGTVFPIHDIIVLVLSVAAMVYSGFASEGTKERIKTMPGLSVSVKTIICFVLALAIVVFGAYGVGYLPPDPIYGGF